MTKRMMAVVLWATCVSPLIAGQAPGVGTPQPPVSGSRPDWTPGTESLGAPVIRAVGAAVRFTAPTDVVVRRSRWTARGRFQVRATIWRAAASSATAEYGLVLSAGDSGSHVAFLIRRDRRVAIVRRTERRVTMLQDWLMAPALTRPAADGSALDTLEIRVDEGKATLLVNNEPAAAVALPPDQVWTPGVQVGSGGDITVAGFRVEGDSLPGQPGRAPVVR